MFIDQAFNEIDSFIDREYPAMEDIPRRYPELSNDELLLLEEKMRKAFAWGGGCLPNGRRPTPRIQ